MADNKQLAEIKNKTVDQVTSKIKNLESRGEIQFPPNYSPQNALRSAWLILQKTQDRDKKPVLQSCDQTSIVNALFDMVVQGLNPAKNQCYFIAYGNQLVCQRSYHGTKAVAKMVDERIADIVAEVVYEGDEFEYEIVRGQKFITKHKQTLQSVDSKKPQGAYCMVLDHDGNILKTEIMTFEQIKQAWKKSQTKPVQENGQLKAGSTHEEFLDEMCRKTVVNRCCKPIINSSSDEYLFRSATRSDETQVEHEAEQEVVENANQETIDVEYEAADEEAEPDPAQEPQENIEQEPLNAEEQKNESDYAGAAAGTGEDNKLNFEEPDF